MTAHWAMQGQPVSPLHWSIDLGSGKTYAPGSNPPASGLQYVYPLGATPDTHPVAFIHSNSGEPAPVEYQNVSPGIRQVHAPGEQAPIHEYQVTAIPALSATGMHADPMQQLGAGAGDPSGPGLGPGLPWAVGTGAGDAFEGWSQATPATAAQSMGVGTGGGTAIPGWLSSLIGQYTPQELKGDPNFLATVAAGSKAESGWDPNSIQHGFSLGSGSGARGLFQFDMAGMGSGIPESNLLGPSGANYEASKIIPLYAHAYENSPQGLTGADRASWVIGQAERPLNYQDPNSAARRNYAEAFSSLDPGQTSTDTSMPGGSGASSAPSSQGFSWDPSQLKPGIPLWQQLSSAGFDQSQLKPGIPLWQQVATAGQSASSGLPTDTTGSSGQMDPMLEMFLMDSMLGPDDSSGDTGGSGLPGLGGGESMTGNNYGWPMANGSNSVGSGQSVDPSVDPGATPSAAAGLPNTGALPGAPSDPSGIVSGLAGGGGTAPTKDPVTGYYFDSSGRPVLTPDGQPISTANAGAAGNSRVQVASTNEDARLGYANILGNARITAAELAHPQALMMQNPQYIDYLKQQLYVQFLQNRDAAALQRGLMALETYSQQTQNALTARGQDIQASLGAYQAARPTVAMAQAGQVSLPTVINNRQFMGSPYGEADVGQTNPDGSPGTGFYNLPQSGGYGINTAADRPDTMQILREGVNEYGSGTWPDWMNGSGQTTAATSADPGQGANPASTDPASADPGGPQTTPGGPPSGGTDSQGPGYPGAQPSATPAPAAAAAPTGDTSTPSPFPISSNNVAGNPATGLDSGYTPQATDFGGTGATPSVASSLPGGSLGQPGPTGTPSPSPATPIPSAIGGTGPSGAAGMASSVYNGNGGPSSAPNIVSGGTDPSQALSQLWAWINSLSPQHGSPGQDPYDMNQFGLQNAGVGNPASGLDTSGQMVTPLQPSDFGGGGEWPYAMSGMDHGSGGGDAAWNKGVGRGDGDGTDPNGSGATDSSGAASGGGSTYTVDGQSFDTNNQSDRATMRTMGFYIDNSGVYAPGSGARVGNTWSGSSSGNNAPDDGHRLPIIGGKPVSPSNGYTGPNTGYIMYKGNPLYNSLFGPGGPDANSAPTSWAPGQGPWSAAPHQVSLQNANPTSVDQMLAAANSAGLGWDQLLNGPSKSGATASDGQSLASQDAATQQMFNAAWGSKAAQQWVAQHNAAISKATPHGGGEWPGVGEAGDFSAGFGAGDGHSMGAAQNLHDIGAGPGLGLPMVSPPGGFHSPVPPQAIVGAGHMFGTPTDSEIPYHKGVDFQAYQGTPVMAPANGTVLDAGDRGPLGLSVRIQDAGGQTHEENHLSGISAHPGQNVAGGEEVGQVGSTGNSTGPHLDYRVRGPSGDFENPELLPQIQILLGGKGDASKKTGKGADATTPPVGTSDSSTAPPSMGAPYGGMFNDYWPTMTKGISNPWDMLLTRGVPASASSSDPTWSQTYGVDPMLMPSFQQQAPDPWMGQGGGDVGSGADANGLLPGDPNYDPSTDPNMAAISDGNGGTTYQDESTGAVYGTFDANGNPTNNPSWTTMGGQTSYTPPSSNYVVNSPPPDQAQPGPAIPSFSTASSSSDPNPTAAAQGTPAVNTGAGNAASAITGLGSTGGTATMPGNTAGGNGIGWDPNELAALTQSDLQQIQAQFQGQLELQNNYLTNAASMQLSALENAYKTAQLNATTEEQLQQAQIAYQQGYDQIQMNLKQQQMTLTQNMQTQQLQAQQEMQGQQLGEQFSQAQMQAQEQLQQAGVQERGQVLSTWGQTAANSPWIAQLTGREPAPSDFGATETSNSPYGTQSGQTAQLLGSLNSGAGWNGSTPGGFDSGNWSSFVPNMDPNAQWSQSGAGWMNTNGMPGSGASPTGFGGADVGSGADSLPYSPGTFVKDPNSALMGEVMNGGYFQPFASWQDYLNAGGPANFTQPGIANWNAPNVKTASAADMATLMGHTGAPAQYDPSAAPTSGVGSTDQASSFANSLAAMKNINTGSGFQLPTLANFGSTPSWQTATAPRSMRYLSHGRASTPAATAGPNWQSFAYQAPQRQAPQSPASGGGEVGSGDDSNTWQDVMGSGQNWQNTGYSWGSGSSTPSSSPTPQSGWPAPPSAEQFAQMGPFARTALQYGLQTAGIPWTSYANMMTQDWRQNGQSADNGLNGWNAPNVTGMQWSLMNPNQQTDYEQQANLFMPTSDWQNLQNRQQQQNTTMTTMNG